MGKVVRKELSRAVAAVRVEASRYLCRCWALACILRDRVLVMTATAQAKSSATRTSVRLAMGKKS